MPWVLLSMAMVTTSGCLVPQDEALLPITPVFRNHPPFFISLDPSQKTIPTNNIGNCPLSFRVTVADPDIDDNVKVRFYVDWVLDPVGGSTQPEREFATTNTGQTVRPETLTFNTNAGSPTSKLNDPQRPHTVEAVVFDGTLSPDRIPENRETLADAGVNPSYAIISHWVVETSEGDCQP